jgi:ketosteroid isomerase-like protein
MPAATAAAESSATERWVEAFAEGWRAPRSADAFADHFEPWLADDVRMIQPQLPVMVGKRAFRERFARPLFALVPDIHATVRGWAASGDDVLIEFVLEGSIHGRRFRMPVVDRMTLRDGLVCERVAYFDPAPLLGAVARSPRAWPGFLRLQVAQRLGGRR